MSKTPDQSPKAAGPLAGVRIVDLTQFVLGPYATQTMGDLGADVIKIEEPSGDRQRTSGKAPNSPTMGPVYVALNRNKRSVVLDLKTEPGREALRRLVGAADIFIHNMRPEAMARLGFAYEAVAAIKPDIVYVEAMGYDPAGPYAGRQAFDDLIQSASGACGLNGLVEPDAVFRPLPTIIADKTSGLFAVIAMLAALRHKERTGEGQYVAVPMLEVFTGFIMAEHLYGETYAPATGHFGHTTTITPHRRPHRTKDGYLSVMPANAEQSARFMALGGLPGAYESERFTSKPRGPARVTEYYAMMDEAALAHTTDEWMQLCAANAVPAMRANRPDEIFDDPQLRETLFEQRQLEGEGPYRAMKPGLRFSKTPVSIRRDPPPLGRHTDEVLAELGAVKAAE
ncbi:MAG TPA: CoA transferase [Caulobacteraceae bacterium]|jgi:crotonobetainyl-CoA:carnitine CoA-transferase CaiB-like acyl-CoA transferase|nr:CoA transferase [Caulobacteraceae bacterium]